MEYTSNRTHVPYGNDCQPREKENTLRPYVAPVNHNVLNMAKAINITHTILGNFCHGGESKNSQMETMGMDSCMIVGYHDKVSENSG